MPGPPELRWFWLLLKQQSGQALFTPLGSSAKVSHVVGIQFHMPYLSKVRCCRTIFKQFW